MPSLDDLLAQIPAGDIAAKLGVDEGQVNSALGLLVPVLLTGLQHNARHPEQASAIESVAGDHAAAGLLDTGVDVDQLDTDAGREAIAKIFGGNDAGQVANALSGGAGGNGELLEKLLPLVAPIVLAYLGKQLGQQKQAPAGALNDVLGSIVNQMSGSGNKSLGSVLGNALGSKAGDILGGLFGGKR
ncbi:DUF937 domain-containing protein [Mycobacterium sp.]|uniref:DUF937 domain-containing protein n=1 Tax=Mycobacterium sp. TaxID=1785 RepID=UPI0012747AD4|nr:DUF937 domain-containing protein [Mycobacterium sp.]KAA8967296.1 MAG: DUF937 domain-containing protein [Mycobacterium sp.]